ncbi:RNA polymerase sigma factor [Brachybacterium hainanense]|uniref:RNA polymerase sigma factor n=1 Tax=Brachybacterium hainanense TaxID=1541174 RepID=A0ABV6RD71_9MICO
MDETFASAPPRIEDERTLVLRAQDGDVTAFEQIIDRVQGRLFRTAAMIVGDRQDAEDVVQETLLHAWKRIELLEEPAALRTWLTRICTRRATDLVRTRARRGTDPGEDRDLEAAADAVLGAAGPAPDPARAAELDAQTRALHEVLSGIEVDLRTCWVLRELEQLSYQEIARIVGSSETTVRGRLARARARVIERMEEWR